MTEKLRTQKDTLAKLMATEDITVVHKRIPTAYFDVKNRILACPIFKEDIPPELYDLFMGHEVGHALNTPYEGLHSTLKENRTLKGYLNVIEDVRIESAIKNKYQGLRKSFFKAYNELMEKDFFGISKRNLQELSLIDKINLITKVGSRVNIKLTDEEESFLDMAYACKTWDDVVVCAQSIYDWSKENETRDENDESIVPSSYQYEESDFEDEDFDDFGGDEGEYEDEDGDHGDESGSEESEDTLPDLETVEGDKPADAISSEESEEEDDDTKDTGTKVAGRNGGGSYDDENGARESITEHNAHNNEDQYLSDANIIKTQFTPPIKELTTDEMLVSWSQVKKDWTEYLSTKDTPKAELMGEHTAKKLEQKSRKIVSHMAKEFDMRQTAQRSKHAFTGKTGKLDMNRLAKYQIVDDVFKRAVYLPEGKNHGLNVMLDWSGSIANEVKDLLEQSLILAEFCRKVQIPYRVYLFSDSYGRDGWDSRDARLIELLSNEQSNRDHKLACKYIGCIYNEYFLREFSFRNYEKAEKAYNEWFSPIDEHFGGYLYMPSSAPNGYGLGGTPLDQTLGYMRVLLPAFNKKYGIEKSILTVITDGYSHTGNLYDKSVSEHDDWDKQWKSIEEDNEYVYRSGVTQSRELIDPFTKKVYTFAIEKGWDRNEFKRTQNILNWIADTTGVIVTGYFVVGKKHEAMNVLHDATGKHHDEDWAEIRKTGKVYSVHGYNKLFITSSNALRVDGTDELDEELVDAKKVRILAAFKKNQKSKTTSRFLTNEFIKEIA